ncbi:hypothetical protein HPP92_001725 [Vanilla planifolia]|uniref:Aluminum-activated malate transporter n=1 Tax=Vanilla planifolia TaxID=51239 RepID=A0A835VDU1_VANPL|nr:hypothetical protein HPP92_001725 [Vanilla planifolia]
MIACMLQAPKSVRLLFREPCIRVSSEVSKVLLKLADSISKRRHFSHDILSDHLHESLQDLNSAIKSQPRLFLGPKNGRALLQWKNRLIDNTKELNDRKQLRPTLSKIAITSLEFSEALPFAAFASLLVEMVARLEIVIEGVEELGRAAHFREIEEDEIAVKVDGENRRHYKISHDVDTHDVLQAAG